LYLLSCAEVFKRSHHPVEVLTVPRGADVQILGRTLGALPLRGQSTDRNERNFVTLERVEKSWRIQRRRVGVAHALGLLGSYGGQPYRARCSSMMAISSSWVARLRGPVCPARTGVSSARRGAQLALTQASHSFSEANLDFTRRGEPLIWTFAMHPGYHGPGERKALQDPGALELRALTETPQSRSRAFPTSATEVPTPAHGGRRRGEAMADRLFRLKHGLPCVRVVWCGVVWCGVVWCGVV
jgi:hypothetical protein